MAEFPEMVFSTDAYLADCDHLNDAEHGRYLLLLMHMWRAPDRRFPNDDNWLARKFRRSVGDVLSQLRPLLAEFFQSDGNWLRHKRLDRDWERLAKQRAKQSVRAKSRWAKEKNASPGNASPAMQRGIATPHVPANPLECNVTEGDGNGTGSYKVLSPCPPVSPLSPTPPFPPLSPQPSISNDSVTGAREPDLADEPKAKPQRVEPDGFAAWYATYPRKVGRDAALRAYRGAVAKKATPEELLDGLMRAKHAWQRAGVAIDFIPHPATWLNRGGWADEHYSPSAARNSYISQVQDAMTGDDDGNGYEAVLSLAGPVEIVCPGRTYTEH